MRSDPRSNSCCGALGRFWHEAAETHALKQCPLSGRSGHAWRVVSTAFVVHEPKRTWTAPKSRSAAECDRYVGVEQRSMGLQEITAWKEHSPLLFAAAHSLLRAPEGGGGVEKPHSS